MSPRCPVYAICGTGTDNPFPFGAWTIECQAKGLEQYFYFTDSVVLYFLKLPEILVELPRYILLATCRCWISHIHSGEILENINGPRRPSFKD